MELYMSTNQGEKVQFFQSQLELVLAAATEVGRIGESIGDIDASENVQKLIAQSIWLGEVLSELKEDDGCFQQDFLQWLDVHWKPKFIDLAISRRDTLKLIIADKIYKAMTPQIKLYIANNHGMIPKELVAEIARENPEIMIHDICYHNPKSVSIYP